MHHFKIAACEKLARMQCEEHILYRSVSHPLQLDEAAGLEPACDSEQVSSGHDLVSQRCVELHHGSHLAGVHLLGALQHALKLLLASALHPHNDQSIYMMCP